jgi:hypothetical protein
MQSIQKVEEIIKEIYLPAWKNQLSIEPTALLSKVKSVPITGPNIKAGSPFGLNGGFGFGTEGMNTPNSGPQMYKGFEVSAKDMFVNIEISDKAMKLASSKSAIVDVLDQEIKSSYAAAKWNVGRSFFGNGKGILANVDALSAAGNTIKVDNVQYLIEGIIIDIYKTGDTPENTAQVEGRRIIDINRVADDNGKYSVTIDGAATTLEAGFITIQHSYGREITGLNAIFDDSITSIYGVLKANNSFVRPIVKDAENDISDSIITQAIRESSNTKNGDIDMILCGDTAFDSYVEYLRSKNQRIEEKTHELKGGFTAIEFLAGNKKVDVVNEKFVPTNEMWGIDTKAMEYHHMDWDFVQKDGGIFTLVPGTSNFRALLADYGDLICSNPGANFRIKNVAF